jgi:hypothetical protein
MPVNLSAEQQSALANQSEQPLRLVDPRSQQTYVLLRAELYEQIKPLLEAGDYDIGETYAAQMEAALRAGWNDPVMDEYNDYDAHRKQS